MPEPGKMRGGGLEVHIFPLRIEEAFNGSALSVKTMQKGLY